MWIPQNLTNEKSQLIQVMAWCRQATNHYLSQYWTRSHHMVSLGLISKYCAKNANFKWRITLWGILDTRFVSEIKFTVISILISGTRDCKFRADYKSFLSKFHYTMFIIICEISLNGLVTHTLKEIMMESRLLKKIFVEFRLAHSLCYLVSDKCFGIMICMLSFILMLISKWTTLNKLTTLSCKKVLH